MKKRIALLLACAMVTTNLCACSSTQLSDVITDLGTTLYEAYENRDEIESDVGGAVTGRIADIAANINSNFESRANSSKQKSTDGENPTREEDIRRALESAANDVEAEGDISVESIPETEIETEKKVASSETIKATEIPSKASSDSKSGTKETETKAKVVDHSLSDALKELFEEDENLEDLVRASIKSAKKINADKETNPVQRIDLLYDFVDESYDDPKIDYFYFLFNQELKDIKSDTNPNGYLEHYESFASWMDDCINAWTKPEEIKAESVAIDCEDDEVYAPADITITDVERTKAKGSNVVTVSAKLSGKQTVLRSPVCGKMHFEEPTGTEMPVTKWDDEKKTYVTTNPLPGRLVVQTEDYGDVVIAPYDFTNRYRFDVNSALKEGKTIDHGDVLGAFVYGGEYVVMGFEANENFEVVTEKNENEEYKPVKAGDIIARLGKPQDALSSLIGGVVDEFEASAEKEAETKAAKEKSNSKSVAQTETEAEIENKTKTNKKVAAAEAESETQKKQEIKYSDDATEFVMLTDVAPKIVQDMRYYSLYNELEKRLSGYEQPALLLTKDAAEAIRRASDNLLSKGYIIKVYDAYRPVSAQEELHKKTGAPETSDNSRGSAIDLTLIDKKTGKELDMSDYMYGYVVEEEPFYTETQLRNQSILEDAMITAGFKASNDWYHFSLEDEPFEDTYFTFPVRFDVAGKTKAEREAEAVEKQVYEEKKRKVRYVIEIYDDGTLDIKQQSDSALEDVE